MRTSSRITAAISTVAIALTMLVTGAVTAGASGAGTNIGNAKQLTGAASGSLPSLLADDWYVVYPATLGGVVQVRVTNTTHGTSCTALEVIARDTNGTMISGVGLGPNTSFNTPFSKTSSDRYFVELKTANCNPPSGPVTYTMQLQSGGGGVAPAPVAASAPQGSSIGNAWPPLQGHRSYTGSIASSITDAWYVLYKHATTSPATIRVENTTVVGSATCVALSAALRNTDGTMVSGVGLNDNTSFTFTVANPGRYYLELTDENCPAGGTTYRIEPEPSGRWDNPARLPMKPMPVGSSLAHAGGPLAGAIIYTSSIASASTNAWVKFRTNGSVPQVTVSVQNTTSNQSTCPAISVAETKANGSMISGVGLGHNTGHEFIVVTAGTFYLHVTDSNCNPGGSPAPTFTVTITPANGVS